MSSLTRDLILAKPLPTTKIKDDWLGEVFVRSLTGAEVDKVAKLQDSDDKDSVGLQATIVSFGLADEQGRSLFTSADLEAIRGFPFKTLNNLTKEINDASGLKKEAVDDAEKN